MNTPALTHFVCTTCGTQYRASSAPPPGCAICLDERQFVPPGGQGWTTRDTLARTHRNTFERLEPRLMGITTAPTFAIGQRALLVSTTQGNVLWDCITLLDQATIDIVGALGGVAAIAVSHPHFYSTVVDWAHAFSCPVYLHADDREWMQRPDSSVVFWEGETRVLPGGLSLVRCGGHFEGSTLLHWPEGAEGRGALLTGDTLHVTPDRRHVTFLRSYPNMIPQSLASVRRVAATVAPLAFDRIYGLWWDRVIESGAAAAVAASAERYIDWVEGRGGHAAA